MPLHSFGGLHLDSTHTLAGVDYADSAPHRRSGTYSRSEPHVTTIFQMESSGAMGCRWDRSSEGSAADTGGPHVFAGSPTPAG